MEQRGRLAAMKDVPIMLLMEEFVADMVLKSNYADTKDVTVMPRKEE